MSTAATGRQGGDRDAYFNQQIQLLQQQLAALTQRVAKLEAK